MYSRKILEPRMEPWETPALTGYSRETSLPKPLKLAVYCWGKKEIRPNIWPEIP